MAEVLLISENFVKKVSSISDNVAGKYILPSILEAQEVKFRGIVGDTLLAKLKAIVDAGQTEAEDNLPYKTLIERSKYFLAYSAIVEVCVKVTFKVANAGVVKTPDENVQVAERPDMESLRSYYQDKADSACLDLQNFILNNYRDYPELTEGECHRIKANLYSAATCGIFLGGARGKGSAKGGCRR